PNSSINTGNFANFLSRIRKNYDEAERLYRRALEFDPNHAVLMGLFANFLSRIRKNYDEAERFYRSSLELDPNHANNTGNFTAFLIAHGRAAEAKEFAERAWTLHNVQVNQLAAEVALYRGLIACLEGKNDTPALGRLKTLLNSGFERE